MGKVVPFVPLGAVAVLLLESATDFFPDDPIAGVLTPTRLVLLIGLAAMAVPVPGRPRDFRTRLDPRSRRGPGTPLMPPKRQAWPPASPCHGTPRAS
ncbi:hypothetical protein GCM10010121_055440 [Streptomyces brasiliensis]|uniref:Uncharacterized protein n=2 Tax=Streptomyces brasiliensis TaxID=1954 RepID=A0A917NYG1_9ACTN|nr:hypothetical protein GCM10010121_055440 [Streptomyces brasiliensis]